MKRAYITSSLDIDNILAGEHTAISPHTLNILNDLGIISTGYQWLYFSKDSEGLSDSKLIAPLEVVRVYMNRKD